MKKYILPAVLAALFVAGVSHAETGGVENGKKIFDKYCVKCHGKDGSGSRYGRSLQPNTARDLRTNRLFFSDNELLIIINHGASWREMPNWQYVLSDGETKDVAEYIRALKYTPNPKDGEKLFKERCDLCHGPEGAAKKIWKAPDLDRSAMGPSEMARTVRYGIHNTLMYPRKSLHTNAEIADVVDYIQGLKK
jgi:mono/diheme cytochrome c family protein